MRTASSTPMTKILPSPTSPLPVRPATASLSTTVSTISDLLTASTLIRGSSAMVMAGHRHERLGVAPHPVLADVKTLHLVGGAGAQTDSLLDGPEQPVAQGEDSRERNRDGDRLGAELVEAPGVEQPALADSVELGQRGDGEQARSEEHTSELQSPY